MDPASMVILTIPFIYPTLTKLGFDPIWVGIVSTLCVEIGMITPPVGLNLFILRAATPVEMWHIIRGALPYVLVLLAGLVILNLFPGLALIIPK
jgi:TRAP-type C4-dicarboxylate transport system permease large subunit